MTNPDIPKSLTEFGAHLDRAAHRELHAGRVSLMSRVPRPRLLAGGSLGLAGGVTAIVLALGGSAASPAFAVSRQDDGSVLVQLSYASNQNLPQVNAKLQSMGTGEQVSIQMATGAAAQAGPVTCAAGPGVTGPVVKVLNGSNGTEVIKPGESADNTAQGTFHLASCTTSPAGSGGNTGS